MYRDVTSKVTSCMSLWSYASSSCCMFSIVLMNAKESFGRCGCVDMCGLRSSSISIAVFSVVHLIPVTIGRSGLPSL